MHCATSGRAAAPQAGARPNQVQALAAKQAASQPATRPAALRAPREARVVTSAGP